MGGGGLTGECDEEGDGREINAKTHCDGAATCVACTCACVLCFALVLRICAQAPYADFMQFMQSLPSREDLHTKNGGDAEHPLKPTI